MAVNILRIVLTSIPLAVIVVLSLILRFMFREECRECFNQIMGFLRVFTGPIGTQPTASTHKKSLVSNRAIPRRSFLEELQISPYTSILKSPHRIIDV